MLKCTPWSGCLCFILFTLVSGEAYPFAILLPQITWNPSSNGGGVWKTRTMKGSHMLAYSNPVIEGRCTLVLWGEERISRRTDTRYAAKLGSKEKRVKKINMCNSIQARESHIKCLECFHQLLSTRCLEHWRVTALGLQISVTLAALLTAHRFTPTCKSYNLVIFCFVLNFKK